MKITPSFLITHISLDKQPGLPKPTANDKGNYLVFWWKDIALGHLFVEPATDFFNKKYKDNFIEAIAPAIEFYNQEQSIEWKTWLLEDRFQDWSDWMNTVLSKWTEPMVPAKVPVSVIICTRDRSAFLQQCLTMLFTLSCLPEEIIVVDNNPKDNSTQQVASAFEGVKYIREPRGGLSIARNTGLLHATYPIISFTDDDAIVHPLWLYRLWETFEDPSVAGMTGLVISLTLDSEAQVIFEKDWTFNRGFVDKTFDSDYFKATIKEGTPVWDIGAGVNMAFRKSVFDTVGNFDERLGAGASGCSEDSELWYRMLMKGLTIKYNPRAIMYHEHRSDMKGLRKQIFAYMKGHTAAALLQHEQYPQSGYHRRIFRTFPKNYLKSAIKGFPLYRAKFSTTWVEIRGILSGIAFYQKVKKKVS